MTFLAEEEINVVQRKQIILQSCGKMQISRETWSISDRLVAVTILLFEWFSTVLVYIINGLHKTN